jgi:PPM family protein phosphatase
MRFEFFSAADTGRARSNNEDAVMVDPDVAVAVLADGMGGYNAGEIASEMAAGRVKQALGTWLREHPATSDAALREAIGSAAAEANRAVYEAATTVAAYAGMGTTLVIAVFREGQVHVGHVGDSRAYRLRAGRLEQITRDHSLLQEQIDAGLITPEDAAMSMNRNLVTRAVGVESAVELELHVHPLVDGDVVLLCSDGLSDMLRDEQIEQVLSAIAEPDAAGHSLIDAANAAGGRDNISLILVRALGGPSSSARSWWPFRR